MMLSQNYSQRPSKLKSHQKSPLRSLIRSKHQSRRPSQLHSLQQSPKQKRQRNPKQRPNLSRQKMTLLNLAIIKFLKAQKVQKDQVVILVMKALEEHLAQEDLV